MANANVSRIVADGPDNAVVELIGTLDTSGSFTVASAVALSDFTNNSKQMTLAGFRIDRIEYSLSDNLTARLFWDATVDQIFAAIAGRGKFCFKHYNGLQPNRAAAGYNGTIILVVDDINIGAPITVQVYTILLVMSKLYSVP